MEHSGNSSSFGGFAAGDGQLILQESQISIFVMMEAVVAIELHGMEP
jgi:hypothetical protein